MNGLLDYFEFYNKRIYPMQIIMPVVAAGLTGLLFLAPGRATTILLKAFLGITFAWIAAACLFLIGDIRKRMPFVPYATAAAYLPLAALFTADIFAEHAAYTTPQAGWRLYASLLLMAWGILVYPLSGYVIGHRYPRIPLFGAMPCPTDIFAIGVLTAFASNSYETTALFILSFIALIGSVKAAFVGYGGERIPEDMALLASGLYGLVVRLAIL
jgi:hypothetical protein